MELNHRVEVPLLNHLYYGIEPYPPAIGGYTRNIIMN